MNFDLDIKVNFEVYKRLLKIACLIDKSEFIEANAVLEKLIKDMEEKD